MTIATLVRGVGNYEDTGLTPSATYYYHAVAVNDVGTTAGADYATVSTQGLPVPQAPTLLTATAVLPTSVRINFQLHGTPQQQQKQVNVLQWNGANWQVIAILPDGSSFFNKSGLAPSHTYYFQVAAINEFGETWAASYATVQTPSVASEQPCRRPRRM